MVRHLQPFKKELYMDLMPARSWLTKDSMTNLLGKKATKEAIESLEQTAHKDIIKGVYQDTEEYLPLQVLIPLEEEGFDLNVWLNGANDGNLELYDDQAEWAKQEEKHFPKKTLSITACECIAFHSKLTHGGTAAKSNFRLFMGITRTPPGFAINEALQSYFQIVLKPNEPYGSYQQVQTYLRPDEDRSSLKTTSPLRRQMLIGNLNQSQEDHWATTSSLFMSEYVKPGNLKWKRPQNKGAARKPHPQPEKPLLLRTLEDLQVPLPLMGKQVRAATFGKVVHKYTRPLFFCVFNLKRVRCLCVVYGGTYQGYAYILA